uniref:Uncharacterized protein n=1 Tax=Setaria viridis TaxID=4556 RepID=A0A4U6TMQ2_SETVI|nr:hypothetical protein SEVIR_7G071000v2 [Setaria viridis]
MRTSKTPAPSPPMTPKNGVHRRILGLNHSTYHATDVSVVFDATTRLVSAAPPFQSPKKSATFWTAGGTIYALDLNSRDASESQERCLFERLGPDHYRNWQWEALPLPPLFKGDRYLELKSQPQRDGVPVLPHCPDVLPRWRAPKVRHGRWTLPFDGETYHIREEFGSDWGRTGVTHICGATEVFLASTYCYMKDGGAVGGEARAVEEPLRAAWWEPQDAAGEGVAHGEGPLARPAEEEQAVARLAGAQEHPGAVLAPGGTGGDRVRDDSAVVLARVHRDGHNVGAPRAAAAEKAWKTSVKARARRAGGSRPGRRSGTRPPSWPNTASTRPSGSGRTDGIMAAFVLLACLGAMAFFLRRRFAIVGLGCGTDGQGNAAIEIWIVI